MPPKPKFTKEQIINAAFSIVRSQGPQALTSRSLGSKLNSSPRPIFTIFNNMSEVENEVLILANSLYKEYVAIGLKDKPAFKGVGIQYILFAIREPKLFQMLFMTERDTALELDNVMLQKNESYYEVLNSISKPYHLSEEDTKNLYHNLWIYTHGIATLCATNMCKFTGEELGKMMTDVFNSLLEKAQSKN